jgi:hypothetical protein
MENLLPSINWPLPFKSFPRYIRLLTIIQLDTSLLKT